SAPVAGRVQWEATHSRKTRSIGVRELSAPRALPRPGAILAILVSCAKEGCKQRMRLKRLGFELWMELAAQEPRMVRDFADFHVHAVRRLAGNAHTACRENLLVFPIELVTMPMPFTDLGLAISF